MEPNTSVARDADGRMGPQDAAAAPPVEEPLAGNFKTLFDAHCKTSRWWDLMLRHPHPLMWLLRLVTPVLRFPFVIPGLPFTRWAIAVRYDEVREILNNSEDFPVPWGEKMVQVTQGKNFVLGMPRNAEYRLSYEQLAEAFPREDVPRHVARPAADFTKRILKEKKAQGEFEFDAVQDLITAVPTELCESYYGLRIHNRALFAKWTLAISKYVFGPSSDDSYVALAKVGAHRLRKTIRDSIGSAKVNPGQGIVLPRMLDMQQRDKRITDDVIHAQLFGMVLGFIPTNVLAGGNILETLLLQPKFMEHACAAAEADDDELLWRCLREALRFRHINPAPWRACPGGYTFREGHFWTMDIRPGSKVLAIIQSAMFDSRRVERPHAFNPERPDENYMVFGVGQHWCIGAYIAKAQLTKTFKQLLKLKGLTAVRNPAVRTERFNNLFPVSLLVGFQS